MYCGKWVSGLIWFFTLGFLGVGWLLDLFLMSGMVDKANALAMARTGANQSQNVVVNLQQPANPVQTQK